MAKMSSQQKVSASSAPARWKCAVSSSTTSLKGLMNAWLRAPHRRPQPAYRGSCPEASLWPPQAEAGDSAGLQSSQCSRPVSCRPSAITFGPQVSAPHSASRGAHARCAAAGREGGAAIWAAPDEEHVLGPLALRPAPHLRPHPWEVHVAPRRARGLPGVLPHQPLRHLASRNEGRLLAPGLRSIPCLAAGARPWGAHLDGPVLTRPRTGAPRP